MLPLASEILGRIVHPDDIQPLVKFKAGYKFDQWLDIIWMDKQLQQPDGSPRPLKPISAFNNNDILKLF